jgi:hypothetical protein
MTGIVIDAAVNKHPGLCVLDRLKTGEQALVPAFWSVEVNTFTTPHWNKPPGRSRSFPAII